MLARDLAAGDLLRIESIDHQRRLPHDAITQRGKVGERPRQLILILHHERRRQRRVDLRPVGDELIHRRDIRGVIGDRHGALGVGGECWRAGELL